MHVRTIRKTKKDFSPGYLTSLERFKPSILDFHVFLKDEFIRLYSRFNLEGIDQLLDPNKEYDEEPHDAFYANLRKEFEFLAGQGVQVLEVSESDGCYCSRDEGGEVFNFRNPISGKSLSYRFTVTSKEFDLSKCFGPAEGNDAWMIYDSKNNKDEFPF